MNDHPVFVRHVRHLTDARYFAAMAVDWISIELTDDPATFAFWHAIREWISGVKLAAENGNADDNLAARIIIDAKPDGFFTPLISPASWPTEVKPIVEVADIQAGVSDECIWIVPFAGAESWVDLPGSVSPDRIFLEANWTVPLLEEVLKAGYAHGICFRGGEEKETGMRDYEEMDEMLALLSA